VPSEVLFDVYEARRKAERPSLVYCGDEQRGKELAAGLIREAGFDPVDAGPLRIARYTEPFALLVGQLAYEGEGGPELAYRFRRFGQLQVPHGVTHRTVCRTSNDFLFCSSRP
jgi:predicted dinucleotide-binding enzyme